MNNKMERDIVTVLDTVTVGEHNVLEHRLLQVDYRCWNAGWMGSAGTIFLGVNCHILELCPPVLYLLFSSPSEQDA